MSSQPASPTKRPSVHQRHSSTPSLSPSGRAAHKAPRPHVVGGRAHGRNVSYSKNLSKLVKINSSTNVAEASRNHPRKKSGPSSPPVPPVSPRSHLKRNSSHVILPKNTSHANLRKNYSANALPRNLSHPTLKKVGLPPAPTRKGEDTYQKQDVFDLGDHSSEEEDEGEWEDTTTQSPEITRDNSKTSTPARALTPADDPVIQRIPERDLPRQQKTSSPPSISPQIRNRSLPDLVVQPNFSPTVRNKENVNDPILLNKRSQPSRAPPAMSTISAQANTSNLLRNESSRSFDHITHDDAATPQINVSISGGAQSSSGEAGVSHFLPSSSPAKAKDTDEDGSDDGHLSSFFETYHPVAPHPQSTSGNRPMPTHLPSRTQQRLELQRREAMRPSGATSTTPPSHSGIGYSLSSASLHSRSGSRGRGRPSLGISFEPKAMKRDYEAAIKQLGVIRRFRNPVLESLNRLKGNEIIPKDAGIVTPAGASAVKSRPQSRHGGSAAFPGGPNGLTTKPGLSRSLEDRKESPIASGTSSAAVSTRSGGDKVQFGLGSEGDFERQRQGSHDDIAFHIGRSQGTSDDEGDEHAGGTEGAGGDASISTEEAMLRRLWESRDVFERPPSRMGRATTRGGRVRDGDEDG